MNQPSSELNFIIKQLKQFVISNIELGLESPVRASDIKASISKPAQQSFDAGSLDDLRKVIGNCQRCGLSNNRRNLVFGEGSSRAKLVFVGEGPGRDEDMKGRPFVGEAGKLLTRIIENGIKLKRNDVYICNVVKCRPPGNRDPEKIEIETCLPFLKEQIRIIKPEVICTLGRIAAQSLTGRKFKITEERGKWLSFMGIPVMPTYHPAYIIRNPARERELKGEVWKDIQAIMARLGLEA